MTTYFIFVQALGVLAMCFDVYATLNKSDKRLVLFHVLGCYTYAIHFYLLGAVSGAVTELLSGTRLAVSMFNKHKYIAYGFIAVYLALIPVLVTTPLDALPLIASIIFTIAVYFLEGIRMRLLFLCNFILWLTYCIYTGSLGGMISYAIMFSATCLTIFKLHRDQK